LDGYAHYLDAGSHKLGSAFGYGQRYRLFAFYRLLRGDLAMSDECDTLDAWWHQQNLDERWIREESMPKVNEMISSKFLRKEDIDEDVRVTVKGVQLEDITDTEQKWVVYFREYPKGMVLNVTTIRVLESAYGDDSDGWIGKVVLLYVDPNVSFQGRVVGGLRIRVPRPTKAAPTRPAPATEAPPQKDPDDPGFDDGIPF
jgi:hypothetical protein